MVSVAQGGRPAGGGSKITVSNGISSSTGGSSGSSGGGGGEGGEVRDESVGEVSAGLDNLRSVVGALQERLRNKVGGSEEAGVSRFTVLKANPVDDYFGC